MVTGEDPDQLASQDPQRFHPLDKPTLTLTRQQKNSSENSLCFCRLLQIFANII